MSLLVSKIEVLDNGRPIPCNGVGRFFLSNQSKGRWTEKVDVSI